ncbi:thermonuclease family protein [Terasakiella pusilla]|uniref:thermonuclease family protein n=1 Tax=Terasakiella pusilla TaxID=64973 RepID=UPI003AA8B80E
MLNRFFNEGMSNAIFQRFQYFNCVLSQRPCGNGKRHKQNNGKESFWVAERVQNRLHNILKFRHTNSVLFWLKGEGRKCGREVGVSAAHLNFAKFITGCLPFGVCGVWKTRKNREGLTFWIGCVVFLSCLFFASSVLSDVPARVLYVIDGDTFKAKINLDGQFHQTSVRVAHIDSPETKIGVQCPAERLAGKKATSFAKGILKREMQVTLQDIKPGFYPGRIIAAVKLPDQRDFGQLMLNAGYAVSYEGGKKHKVWCK